MSDLTEITQETVLVVIALTNGVLYYAIPIEGLRNIQQLVHDENDNAALALRIISGEACLIYTLFIYNTFKNISFRVDSLPKLGLSLFTPFAAASFLTAGKRGSEKVYGNPDIALALGCVLYGFRALTFLDGAIKFPAHFPELLAIFKRAFDNNNYAEMSRIGAALLISSFYSIAITDSVYGAGQSIADWTGMPIESRHGFSLAAAILGMLGTFPLASYGIYRGISEITASENDPTPVNEVENGQRTVIQTDRYTWFALLLVVPSSIGALGGVTSATGAVFGQAGYFSMVVRLIASIFYAIFMGTPPVSRFLRSLFACLCEAERVETPAPPRQIIVLEDEIAAEQSEQAEELARPSASATIDPSYEPAFFQRAAPASTTNPLIFSPS
jgi:hypothetical protein